MHQTSIALSPLKFVIRGLGMPRSLKDVGVHEKDLPALAGYIFQDIWCGTNPRPVSDAASLIDFLRPAL